MSSSTVQASRCDWDRDEFMAEWDKTYVSTNLKAGAKKYDDDFFTRLYHTLSTIPDLSRIAHCIIVSCLFRAFLSQVCLTGLTTMLLFKAATSIAVGRADVVGRIFDSLTTNMTPEESTQRFTQLRETLLIIYPFLGIPTVVPASYGIIGVLERKGRQYGNAPRVRKEYMDAEDVKNGKELRARVYQGVGNGKIFGLMEKHFTDLCKSTMALYSCSSFTDTEQMHVRPISAGDIWSALQIGQYSQSRSLILSLQALLQL